MIQEELITVETDDGETIVDVSFDSVRRAKGHFKFGWYMTVKCTEHPLLLN